MPDSPASRFIRIGQASVGLVGLNVALHAAARQQLTDDAAADFLFTKIKAENYIPPGCEAQYREALLAAWRRCCGAESGSGQGLVIRIFGTDCVSCNRLHSMLIGLLDRLGIAADVEQIYDPDEIGRHGVTMTPALMINGRIRCAGLLPSPAQVELWLREQL